MSQSPPTVITGLGSSFHRFTSTGRHLESRRSRVGVDEQQGWCPLATEQEVKRVVLSHGSHVQQVAIGWHRWGVRI